MPTYEYKCEACGHALTELQGMNDPPLSTCPHCGGSLRRLVSAGAGIVMKGAQGEGASSCDRSSPCCGRATPCDTRPCE